MNHPKLPSFFYPIGVIALGILVFYPFEGGVVFNLFGRPYLVLPLLILVLILLIGLINSGLSALVGREKLAPIKKYSGLALIVIFGLEWALTAEVFKSDILLVASLNDDLFHEHLVLRENGTCEVETAGWLGFNQIEKSHYTFKADTIHLNFSGEAIPPFGNLLLVDTTQHAIYFDRDNSGQFNQNLEWLNYLEIGIISNELWN